MSRYLLLTCRARVPIVHRMRRKPGTLLPLELAVCASAADLLADGVTEFHGYALARRLANIAEHRLLTGYGTLYRTLGRLEKMGLLESRWEDPLIPAREYRPARRLYVLTSLGMKAAQDALAASAQHAPKGPRRLAPA